MLPRLRPRAYFSSPPHRVQPPLLSLPSPAKIRFPHGTGINFAAVDLHKPASPPLPIISLPLAPLLLCTSSSHRRPWPPPHRLITPAPGVSAAAGELCLRVSPSFSSNLI